MIYILRSELLIVFLIYLTIFGVKPKGTSHCHCPGGCSTPPSPCVSKCQRGWDGAFCQRHNIALGQHTEQTGSFNDTPECPPPDPHFGPWGCGVKRSGLAVDGDTDHTYWHGSCSHTIPGNYTARWSVDLGGIHVVSHVVIHTDETQPETLKSFQLYVDGHWCQNWTAPDGDTLVADITCLQPLFGSNLTVTSEPNRNNQGNPVLDLCEVQVYECSDFWFGIQCDKKCHCRNVSEVCDKIKGHCASGCVFGRDGSDCQMINVAFNKTASQSSTDNSCHNSTSVTASNSYCGANLAVDGDHLQGSCSYTNPSQTGAYWNVDLGHTRDIHSIRIYNNENHLNNLKGVEVKVDGHVCYLSDNITTPSIVMDITCMEDMAGSNISIILPSWIPGQHILSLCEVEVYECDNYRFGHNCDNFCNCNDVTEVCNKTTGQCRSGCAAGFSGLNCTQGCDNGRFGTNCGRTCGHCANGADCSPVTGLCPDALCSLWWNGPRCDECSNGTYLHGNYCEPCTGCMKFDCNNMTGRCRQGCQAGYTGYICHQQCLPFTHGIDCSLQCGMCRNNRSCEPRTGNCIGGCVQNFTGATCKDCKGGLYGKGCNLTCGECFDGGQCDKMTGNCTQGCRLNRREPLCADCIVSRYGSQCDRVCGHCLYGENCDRATGNCTRGCGKGWSGRMCLDCDVGYYGANCTICGQCSNKKTCNATSGICPDGCAPGWTTDLCNKECRDGLYGANCTSACGHCAYNVTCDSESGQCPGQKCGPGFTGSRCTTVCQFGFYGSNCEFPCGRCRDNQTCDRLTGHCPGGRCMPGYREPFCHGTGGCQRGYYGPNCSRICDNCQNLPVVSKTKPGVIAAAVIVPVLVLSIVISIVVWRLRRSRREKSEHEMVDVVRERRPRHVPS